LRKTLAQQSCLQPKGPVRRYRPDAEAPDAPLRIAVLSIGQRHSLRVGPGCPTGSAQVQNFANAFPSRREGRIFLRPRYVSLAWSQAADQYPHLSNRVRAAASEDLHYPDAEPQSPWASPCRPPWLPLLSVKGVSPNCRSAQARGPHARAGRRARSVGCRGPCVFERLMYLAAFSLSATFEISRGIGIGRPK
jgi:hypothetical protein